MPAEVAAMGHVVIPFLLAAAAAAPATVEPMLLAPNAATALLVTDVQKDPHKLTLPGELAGPDAHYWGLYKVCVDTSGAVAKVQVVRSASQRDQGPIPPAAKNLDERWTTVVKTWRYRPHEVQGRAAPFCYFARLQIGRPAWDPEKAVMVAPNVGTGLRLTNVHEAPHRPTLPPELNRDGNILWGIYKVCVGRNGQVAHVNAIKSANHPGLDARWIGVIRGWRYKPHVVNGESVPFCHPMRLEVRA